MRKNMTQWGIGTKLALIGVPYFIIALIISRLWNNVFAFNIAPRSYIMALGLILLFIGIKFYIKTLKTFVLHFNQGVLLTRGTYSMCRNPIYSSFIVFFIPAISLLVNSWLCLTTFVVVYIMFKLNIENEYNCLKEKFKEDYINYENKVNELFPMYRIKKM